MTESDHDAQSIIAILQRIDKRLERIDDKLALIANDTGWIPRD